ncbi:MAG: Rne/Rng family ribonuclease [Acidobacteriia bacterium]|nr:Rne/Rng family ribonuclease [Terriglobia bacterium]
MTKELFVSSTPHETRVGMVEDDLLAEIYLERENEYTLAGSIYKGRVTRVLPGMQSAFVDIGLERDAFLYVSDFMELQDEEDVDEIPAGRPIQAYQPQPETQTASEPEAPTIEARTTAEEHVAAAPLPSENREKTNGGEQREGRGDWQNRRRRRGRRGERMPESRFARGSEPPRNDRPERSDFGPPPGYQPILLPGESISKYQRMTQNQPAASQTREEEPAAPSQVRAPLTSSFPEDEPLFVKAETPARSQEPANAAREMRAKGVAANAEVGSPEWDREQQRLHHMNVAAIFGGAATEEEVVEDDDKHVAVPEHTDQPQVSGKPAAGTLEEEEIEEEEADIAAYVDDLEEDAAFEEMEEETQHAEDYARPAPQIVAVEGESAAGVGELPAASLAEGVTAEEEVEEEEEEAEDAELEEAQAEAEALLDAEARGNGTVEAQAEVRAPSSTAGYTQRAQRPGFGRRGGPRGRRGGRRFPRREPQNVPLITDLLKEGQEILVQIAKEPIAKKGARITSHIALPGRFLVYMPTVHHTGVSRKISSEEERQRLKRIILSERENGHGGFIVRTAAQGASEDELRADIRFLKGLWSEIKTRAEMGKGPTLIYHDLNVVERVLRDQVTSDFTAIWVDNEQEYERILRFANRFQPALVKRVKLYTKETPLFDQFGLTDEINKALKSKVWLKSGGYIVINQAEALVAIDVNTGKYVGKTARLEDTIVKTNVDAIKEIVRQVRLRDLGGIIIIDFIDMDERRNRQKVMQALEEALRGDRAPSKVLQFNDFGLVAITRKRVKQSLERTIGSPCPYCQSTGFVKSPVTVCNEIYLEMRKMAKHLEHSDVMLRVNPEVAKTLKTNNGRLLNEMEELTKKTVIVKSDPALHQEQFDIN